VEGISGISFCKGWDAADDLGAGNLRQRTRTELDIFLPMRLQHVGDDEIVFRARRR